jgi:ligand-binding sensor domain-containing protein/DNA-binding CsgD family transcriptional regulator
MSAVICRTAEREMPRKREALAYPGESFWRFCFFCLLILLSLPLYPVPRQVELRFRNFGIEEGLSTEFVTDLFMDRRGILWVSTEYGLNSFDGYSFRHYRHQPGDLNSLSDNEILVMHDDQLGRMWIRAGPGLDILDPHSGRVSHLGQPEVKWGTTICSMEETRCGEMWLGTMTGKVFLMESASGRILPLPAPLRSNIGLGYPIAQIMEDDRGDIWMGSLGGILRYTPSSGRLSRFRASGSSICLDEHGMLWFARGTRLGRLDPVRGTFRLFPLPNRPDTLVDWMFLLADPSGLIWFGTNLGLALFDSKSGEYIDSIKFRGEPRGVVPKYIAGLCQDAAGNIWMGTLGTGLCRFNPRVNRFRFIGSDPDPRLGLRDPWVNCLLEDRAGIVWIGTRYGGLSSFNPASATFTHFTDLPAFPRPGLDTAKSVFSFCQDSGGSLWVGAASGLFLFDRQNRKFRLFDLPPVLHPSYKYTQKISALWPRIITSIREEGPNTLWISTYDEGVFRVDKKLHTSTLFKMDEIIPAGLFPRRLNGMFLDRSQSVWICTMNGLQRLDRTSGRISHFLPDAKKPGAVSGKNVNCVLEDRNGNFWVGTDQGINLMDRRHGTFKAFAEKDGLAGGSVSCLAEDDDGFIWAGTNLGLSRFDPRRETFRNFGSGDGVAIGGAECLIRCRDGRLLAGSAKGLLSFDPREVARLNSHVPPVVFTALHIGKRPVPLQEVFSRPDQAARPGRIVLRPGDKVLAVEFAALDLSAPEKNRYAFRMEEQGREWSDLGTQRQITFSGMGVGEHTLRIKGSNNDGVWNETGLVLQILVLPHFWQTWWFKLLALLLLAGIALAIYAVCRTIASLKKIATPPKLDEIFNKHKISHREQEILHMVIQGKSNREMEQVLFISLPTVKRHLANIYEKIGVSSRLQLINFLQGRKARY